MSLGDKSYLRTEDNDRVLHVFVHGAVLSVTAVIGPPGSAAAAGGSGESAAGAGADEVGVSRVSSSGSPEQPCTRCRRTRSSTAAPPRRACDEVDATVLAETLGRPPTLDAGLAFGNGSLICSWSGQPGSVTMTLTDDPLRPPALPCTPTQPTSRSPWQVCCRPTRGEPCRVPRSRATWRSRSATTSSMTLQVIPAAGLHRRRHRHHGQRTQGRQGRAGPAEPDAVNPQGQALASSSRVSRSSCGSTLVWPDHRHEVGVTAPARHDVLVEMRGDACTRDVPLVHPDVEAVRPRRASRMALIACRVSSAISATSAVSRSV